MENKNTLTIILAIGIILISLFAIYSYSAVQDQDDTVSVSGTASLDAIPDQAEVYLRIDSFDIAINEAQSKNTAISNKVIELLKSKNVLVETVGYNLEPYREWENNKYVDKGYKASHTLKLTVTDLNSLGSIIQLAVENGVNNVDSVRFGLTKNKENEVRSELLSKATSDARTKADLLAQALNSKIKGVVSVSESIPYSPPFYYYNEAIKTSASEAPIITPQSISLTTTVSVVFEI